eukprot:6193204-Pleurochrysis_carterae.AAC.1
MVAVDVLGPLTVLWVVCKVGRGLVVQGQRRWLGGRQPEVNEKGAQVNGLLRGLLRGDDLGLARGKLLRRP